MSVQDLQSNPEAGEAAEDQVVRRLVRAIDYAEGFWLGLAKSNTPAQRRRLAALCKDLLEPLKVRVLEIKLNKPVTDLLPVLRERLAHERAALDEDAPSSEASAPAGDAEVSDATSGPRAPAVEARATGQPKLAIFVYGLERSIPSREAYPPLLSSLNLNRELFRQQVPHPLLLWLPDYALTALARKAPDFWAWRSGLYEFPPERDAAEQSLKEVSSQPMHITESLPEQAKRERLVMLKGLLEDYRELGDGPHEQEAKTNILNEIGLTHDMLGEWTDAKQAFEESLTISRNLNDGEGEAVALHNLGGMALYRGEIEEARRLYGESLEIKKRLGNQGGVAITLHNLAMLAQNQDEVGEAGRLYGESLEIRKRLGDQDGVASTLHQLAILAGREGDLGEARRLFNESLEITNGLGDKSNLALIFHNLGLLEEKEGNKAEAARLLREALSIFERLGSPYAKIARESLAWVEGGGDAPD